MFKKAKIIAVFAIRMACRQNVPLADYEPKSQQELALKKVLLEFQDAVIHQYSIGKRRAPRKSCHIVLLGRRLLDAYWADACWLVGRSQTP